MGEFAEPGVEDEEFVEEMFGVLAGLDRFGCEQVELGLGGLALFGEVGEPLAQPGGPFLVDGGVAGGLVGLQFGEDVGLLPL